MHASAWVHDQAPNFVKTTPYLPLKFVKDTVNLLLNYIKTILHLPFKNVKIDLGKSDRRF